MKLDILSSGADDTADLNNLQIDADFARRFEHNKQRESLHRLQSLENLGLASKSDSDSSSDSEPDPELDLGFVRALNLLKNQDPILKKPDTKLFDEPDDQRNQVAGAKKEKPLYLKDVNARTLIELGPELEHDPLKHKSKIYKSEQADDIRAFHEAEKKAFQSENGDDDFLKQKETAGGDEEEPNDKAIQDELEAFWKDNVLDEGDKFLKDYICEQKWIDKQKDRNKVMSDVDVSEDENELEKQERYEVGFNFRYEEPEQADRVLGHSRVMEGSVRKKKSSREVQRKSKKERMEQAEFERKEELKYLKNLKKKEIQEKLAKVRAIAGIGEGASCKLDADDLEEDFDPEEYDRKMSDMFGDDYYEEDEDPEEYKKMEELYGDDRYEEDEDPKKPKFSNHDDELIAEGNNMKGAFAAAHEKYLKQYEEEEEESEDEEPDDGEPEEEEPEEEEGKRKKKKQKISLKEKVALEKELEEYYKLDYEDTIDDLKTRFKYRTVKPNRFGLKREEIWQAEDKNLNQYVPLKKIAPYAEEWETTYHVKKRRRQILGLDSSEISNKHGKSGGERSSQAEMKSEDVQNLSKRSKRRHRQKELKPSLNRLDAYGKGPAKPQKKKH